MTLPNETIATGALSTCPDCNKQLELEVLRSGAGFYFGTTCVCGPYSRESGYYGSYLEAHDALKRGHFGR